MSGIFHLIFLDLHCPWRFLLPSIRIRRDYCTQVMYYLQSYSEIFTQKVPPTAGVAHSHGPDLLPFWVPRAPLAAQVTLTESRMPDPVTVHLQPSKSLCSSRAPHENATISERTRPSVDSWSGARMRPWTNGKHSGEKGLEKRGASIPSAQPEGPAAGIGVQLAQDKAAPVPGVPDTDTLLRGGHGGSKHRRPP